MRRFFINPDNIHDDTALITGDEARHIYNVLRLGANDMLQFFDSSGTTYTASILSARTGEIRVRVLSVQPADQRDIPDVILCQALPKSGKMDSIVQKSTELGVSAIIPFCCTRSIPRWDRNKSIQKREHWQRIAISAVKQSGIRPVPPVEPIISFSDLCRRDFSSFVKVVLWENETEKNIRQVLSEQTAQKNFVFAVGPEGGFTDDEIGMARSNGFEPAGLGKAILRTETVPVAVLSILGYEHGTFG